MADQVRNWIFALLSGNGNEPLSLTQLEAQYKELEGCFIPAESLGYPNTVALLESMDNVQVETTDGRILVKAVDCVDTRHVVKLIKDQKKNPAKTSPWTIPQTVEKNILTILAASPKDLLPLSQLNAQYLHFYETKLPAPRGHTLAWLNTATKFVVTNESGSCHMIQPMRDVDMAPYHGAAQRLRAQVIARVRNRSSTQPILTSKGRLQRGRIVRPSTADPDRVGQTQCTEASWKKPAAASSKLTATSTGAPTVPGITEKSNDQMSEMDKAFFGSSAALTAPSGASPRARGEPVKTAQESTMSTSVKVGPAKVAPESVPAVPSKTEPTRTPPLSLGRTTAESRWTMPWSGSTAPARMDPPKTVSPQAAPVTSTNGSTNTALSMASPALTAEPTKVVPQFVTSAPPTTDPASTTQATVPDAPPSRSEPGGWIPQPWSLDPAKSATGVQQVAACRPKTNPIWTVPYAGTPATAKLNSLAAKLAGSLWGEPAKRIAQPTAALHNRMQPSADPSPPSQPSPAWSELAGTTNDAPKVTELGKPNSAVVVNTVRRQVASAVFSNRRLTRPQAAGPNESSPSDPTQGSGSFVPQPTPTAPIVRPSIRQDPPRSLQQPQFRPPMLSTAGASPASADRQKGNAQTPMGPAPVIPMATIPIGSPGTNHARIPPPQWIIQMATRPKSDEASEPPTAATAATSTAKRPNASVSGAKNPPNPTGKPDMFRSFTAAPPTDLIARIALTPRPASANNLPPPFGTALAAGGDQWQGKKDSETQTRETQTAGRSGGHRWNPTQAAGRAELRQGDYASAQAGRYEERRKDKAGEPRRPGTLSPMLCTDEPVVELFGLPLDKLLNVVSFLQEHPPVSVSFLNDVYFAAYSEELVAREQLPSVIDTLESEGILETRQGSHSLTVTAKGSRPCETSYLVRTTSVNLQNDVQEEELHGKVEGSDELSYKLLPVRDPVDVSTLQEGVGSIAAGEAYIWGRKDRHDVVVATSCVSGPGPKGRYWSVCLETGAQAIVNESALFKLAGSGVDAPARPLTIWPAGRRPANGEVVSVKVLKRLPNGPLVCRFSDEELLSIYLPRHPSSASLVPISILRWGGLTYLLNTSLAALGVQSKSEIPIQCMKYADALTEFLGREGIPANSSFVSVTDLVELLAQAGVERELIADMLRL